MAYIKENLILNGLLKDYDSDPSSKNYNDTYTLNYRWDCFDINNDLKPCTNKYGDLLVFDSLCK